MLLVLATAGRDSPRRATNFLAARPVCRPRRKSAKKRALHPASPKASLCESFGATCARSKRRRAVELTPSQGSPVKQLPRVRARSLAVLRQPNRRRLLRSQALAEGIEEQPTAFKNCTACLLLPLSLLSGRIRKPFVRSPPFHGESKKPPARNRWLFVGRWWLIVCGLRWLFLPRPPDRHPLVASTCRTPGGWP